MKPISKKKQKFYIFASKKYYMKTNMKHSLLILLFTISCYCEGIGQNSFLFKQCISNNFPQLTINDIDQDKNGFIWIYSEFNGIFRYDGNNFLSLKQILNVSSKTPLEGKMYIDHNNRMWIYGNKVFYIYDCTNNKLCNIPNTLKNNGITTISSIIEDKKKFLWILSNKKLYRYDPCLGKLNIIDSSNNSPIDAYKNYIWATNNSEIIMYDINNFKKRTFTPSINNRKIISISRIKQVSPNEILIGTGSKYGLFLYNINNNTCKILIKDDYIKDIEQREPNEYWIASETGLHIYNFKQQTLIQILKDRYNPFGLQDNATYCLKADKEKGLWIGSYFQGLSYLPKRILDYSYINPQLLNQANKGCAVRSIIKAPDKTLWVGTEDGGLNHINLQTNKCINFSAENNKNKLAASNIHGLIYYNERIWIGSLDGGIDVLNPQTGKVESHYTCKDKTGLPDFDFTLYFEKEHSGKLLLGTSTGVILYNPTDKTFKLLTKGYVFSITEDSKHRIWCAYHNGIKLARTRFQFKDVKGLVSETGDKISVFYVKEDSKGSIWAATEKGLFRYNEKASNFTKFKISDNAFTNNIRRIEEDQFHNLWLSTENGLVRFNPYTQDKLYFMFNNEPCSNKFNYSSSLKDENGILYFGSINGLIYFKPKKDYKPAFQIPIVISSFSFISPEKKHGFFSVYGNLSNKKYDGSLSYENNYVRLTFRAMSYSLPNDFKYAYRIDGLTNGWIEIGGNSLELQNLSPGNYKILIKSTDGIGNWLNNEVTYTFTISPPFYLSSLAYCLYIIMAVLIAWRIYQIIKIKEKRKRSAFEKEVKNQTEKELYDAKIHFFTTIAHEIKTPLSLINAPLEEIDKDPSSVTIEKYLPLIKRNSDWLTNLCSQLLDFRNLEGKHLHLNYIPTDIYSFLQEIIVDFIPIAEKKNISIEIISKNQEKDKIINIDQDIVKKIICNLLNNAIKYANKEIGIDIYEENHKLEFSIYNDGEVLQPQDEKQIFEMFYRKDVSHKGNGIGLSFSKELAKMHNGDLTIIFDKPEMTHFLFTIPFNEAVINNTYNNSILPEEAKQTFPQNETTALLIVEDNKDLSVFLKNYFCSYYKVYTASNSNFALKRLKSNDINIILSDVLMPGISGIELCKIVKTTKEYSHIPFLILTADTSLASKLSGLENGADDYIEKPFSISYLHARIQNILSNRENLYNEFTSKPLYSFKNVPIKNKTEKDFIEKLTNLIENNLSRSELDADYVASEMRLSKPSLYRKLKGSIQMGLCDYVLLCRLKKAAKLLSENEMRINEIAYEVGFSSPSYFSNRFLKQFGMTPSEFIEKDIKKEEDNTKL